MIELYNTADCHYSCYDNKPFSPVYSYKQLLNNIPNGSSNTTKKNKD